jgi:hypothetical protein
MQQRIIGLLSLSSIILCAAVSAYAQQAAAPQPAPLFFKETWKRAPGNVPVTQEYVTNPDLHLTIYGATKQDSATSPTTFSTK